MKIINYFLVGAILLVINNVSNAQNIYYLTDDLIWEYDLEAQVHDGTTTKYLSFKGASHAGINPFLPAYSKKINIPGNGRIQARLIEANYQSIDSDYPGLNDIVQKKLNIHTQITQEKNSFHAYVHFYPLIASGTDIQALDNFKIELTFLPENTFGPEKNIEFTTESVLSNGSIYKLAVNQEGIHKLDYDFLKNELGIAELDNIDPRQIKVYGNRGGNIAEALADDRQDDLVENHIMVVGEEDGRFDSEDYILFYATGADQLLYDSENRTINYQKNFYDTQNFYFIKVNAGNGLRIQNQLSTGNAQRQSNVYQDLIHHEQEQSNLLGSFGSAQGSGKLWFGEQFKNIRQRDFSGFFNFPNLNTNEDLIIKLQFAGRSGNSSRIRLSANGQNFERNISAVSVADVERTYASLITMDETFQSNDGNLDISLEYLENGVSSEGWLDYISIMASRNAVFQGSDLTLVDFESLDFETSSFIVNGLDQNSEIWDITDPSQVKIQDYNLNSGQGSFSYNSSSLRRFLVFDANKEFFQAEAIGQIANQNLHSISELEYLIIYHPDFKEHAERLAEHRSNQNGLLSRAVNIEEVFNEFSSGRQDVCAVRDFAKMLFDRYEGFNYLLLFGDASYDYKHILTDLPDQNYVLTYQTNESLDPITAFPSDDFYGLLNDFEGDDLKGELDIAVGRIPVKTSDEAKAVVDKIILYDTDPETLGDWRIRASFAADDEDSNIHLNQADFIADRVLNAHPMINIDKIYWDAFKQESTPGGNRYPEATKKINENIFKGNLILNYLGHGGPKGWSQERVLKIDDINNWENKYKMPILVTATCSFTGFDDPALISAGEYSILKQEGGAIGLFTTVRAVYSFENKRLTEAVFDTIYKQTDGEYLPLGEVMRRAKNTNWQDTARTNARKFFFIGDPSQLLALPKYNVTTTKINGLDVSDTPDTLRALQTVSIEGQITDNQGAIVEDFNGQIFTTVFDKKTNASTLGNDGGSSPKSFKIQKNILFKGTASVSNGRFNFNFVIPKDINYSFGSGKISYYASDGQSVDAAGYFDDVIIGGTSSDISDDDEGPQVGVFMNDEGFVSGGITSADPILFVKLKDDIGINLSTASIGHEISAVLDANSQNTFILNEFYEAALDNYQEGSIRFPLNDLEEGLHTITVRAFDTANNKGEGMTEFYVTNTEEAALSHVLNYPNPFTTSTNFQFEHNLSGTNLDVLINIYTVSGKLVKTIEHTTFADGFREHSIHWEGRDDFGDQLAKGVYLYKIKVFSRELDLTKESEFEKLVILK